MHVQVSGALLLDVHRPSQRESRNSSARSERDTILRCFLEPGTPVSTWSMSIAVSTRRGKRRACQRCLLSGQHREGGLCRRAGVARFLHCLSGLLRARPLRRGRRGRMGGVLFPPRRTAEAATGYIMILLDTPIIPNPNGTCIAEEGNFSHLWVL